MFDSGHGTALVLAVVIAVIYLILVRFLDLNEKEPLWAVVMLFIFGAVGGAVVVMAIDSVTLTADLWRSALAEEIARFAAIAVGIAVLTGMSRSRGWSELNGLMDGLVYGAAAGLGFAVGQQLLNTILVPRSSMPAVFVPSFGQMLWTQALAGLSDGMFGAIIGAGFGLSARGRNFVERYLLPVALLVVAILVHAAYHWLAYGDALSSSGYARVWIALLIPVALFVVLAAYALLWERRAINDELNDELASGVVTDSDLAMLRSFTARQAKYLSAMTSGQLGAWGSTRAIHNLQVELAMAKRRLRNESAPEARAALESEVARIREAIRALRSGGQLAGA